MNNADKTDGALLYEPEKRSVTEMIDKTGLIIIVRGVPSEKLPQLAEALYDGGVRLLEVTFDACGKKTDAETAADIEILVKKFKGRMYIGAGTVLTKEQVRLTKKAGGSFIISPNTDKDVITESRMCGLVSIPGAMTATKINNAHNFGADYVKLFPVTNLDADYIQPDISHAGGIMELKKIAAEAGCRYIPFAPHNPSGPVANAATLQFAANTPNFCILEIMYSDVEWRKDITNESLEYKDGYITIPDKPGLGIEINEEECLKHPYKPHTLRHYDGTLTDIRPAKTEFYF